MKVEFENLQIRAVRSVLPHQAENLHGLAGLYGKEVVNKIIRTTGIRQVRKAQHSITASDLCYSAARLLFERSGIGPDEIDGLVFVSQTRDHLLPQSSSALQFRLGLPEETICFDLPVGCSGYIYGLYQAALLLSSGSCKKVLVLAGDTTTRIVNELDRASRMVFGDGGSATLMEVGENKMYFNIQNDGSGVSKLIVPAGGFRIPHSTETVLVEPAEDGNKRSKNDLFMDGMGIFEFANSRVPKLIKDSLLDCSWAKEEVELYLFHQANEFIVNLMRRRLGLTSTQVPFEAGSYGNTGPASIPLLLGSLETKSINTLNKDKIVLSGFGVGLSWASCLTSLHKTIIYKTTLV